MAHGLESGASVTHHRGGFSDPDQLVALNAVLPGQHQHRNRCDSPFDSLAVVAHQLAVALRGPSVAGAVPARPVVLQSSLTILHAEVLPAVLLGQKWIDPLPEQPSVLH